MNPDIKKLQQAQVSCGSTEGRADEHKPDGQDAEEGSTNRVNDSEVCIRLLDPDCDQDQGLQQIPTPKHYQLQVPASGYQAPPAGTVLPESELRTQRELPTAMTSPANGIPFQYSPTTEASGLGATASAKAGSYGESASCTETAGAEIPTEFRTLPVCESSRQDSGSTGAQEGPSVASPTHIGVDAGIEGKGDDCQSPFMTFDEEYGRTYKERFYSGEMIEDLLGTVMRAERGELRG